MKQKILMTSCAERLLKRFPFNLRLPMTMAAEYDDVTCGASTSFDFGVFERHCQAPWPRIVAMSLVSATLSTKRLGFALP